MRTQVQILRTRVEAGCIVQTKTPLGLQEHGREIEKPPEAQGPASLAHTAQTQETLLSSDLRMSYTIHALPHSHTHTHTQAYRCAVQMLTLGVFLCCSLCLPFWPILIH